MLHTNRVIYMILPLLFVPVVYGLSSTPNACAEPKDPNWGKTGYCYYEEDDPDFPFVWTTCCWEEPDILNPGETIQLCQTCDDLANCGDIYQRGSSTGPFTPPQDGVLEEPLTPPTSPFAPPLGGVLEQQPLTPTTTPPPLFGRNDPNVPLQGGGVFGQPTTVTTPTPTPPPTTPFGPTGGVFDPPKTAPTIILTPFPFPSPSPTPPPTTPFGPTEGIFDPPKVSPPTGPIFPVSPTLPIPPQEDGSGPLNPQGGGILQQPEGVEDPEDEGENEEEEGSSEGAETAGPLT